MKENCNNKAKLCYINTDGFMIYIKPEDCYKVIAGTIVKVFPNGHTTSNRRRFDVDIMSIRQRPNFDEFPSRFHVLFRCNFADRKIHVVSTYFFGCNFDGGKIHVVSTHFLDVILMVEKSTLFPRTFFDVISMVKKSMSFPRTFFDVISFVEVSTVFLLTFFDVILIVE